jgi:hypothetical protein
MQSPQQTFASNEAETIAGSNGWPVMQYSTNFLAFITSSLCDSKYQLPCSLKSTTKHSIAAPPKYLENQSTLSSSSFPRFGGFVGD